MPNWCEDELTIQIDKKGHPSQRRKRLEALKRFMKDARDPKEPEEHISADRFIPMPKKLRKGNGWYDWCIANWGTKWGFCHTQPPEELGEGKILYRFDTAWSPPGPLVMKMSEMYPEFIFTLKYWECGSAFKGILKTQAGKIMTDKNSTYHGGRGG